MSNNNNNNNPVMCIICKVNKADHKYPSWTNPVPSSEGPLPDKEDLILHPMCNMCGTWYEQENERELIKSAKTPNYNGNDFDKVVLERTRRRFDLRFHDNGNFRKRTKQ